ncbi:hypothetical protein BROUX41_001166 [Berkeleyomyces rouxiae]|uniref:uncharacterized protein n=1 Tax=Berkeleyomyces rouxiae TaxID=2035830 RepID=UPI003B78F9DB
MAKKGQKTAGGDARIQDPRFASFETDPRFRLPSKKNVKTKLDKRFTRMLEDDEFTTTAKVDRYGRKITADKKKKALERLYEKEEDDDDEDDEASDQDNALGGDAAESDEDEPAVESDAVVRRELRAMTAKYDPARDGGFSSSDEDSEDDDINEDDETALKGSMQRLTDEQADVEEGEVTRRVAIVNLDWDHIKAADLMALFTSFLPSNGTGKVLRVSVYPSEFGKERMAREELEGPSKEIFKGAPKIDDINDKTSKDSDEEEEDSEAEDERIKKELLKEATDQDFDNDALRDYQLDRLRYFYAVMECSDAQTAKALYDQTDGTEYLSSSNFLDLRFVPDDVTFDDEPRDEATKVPKGYKPVEFVTNALQSSKVKLTWDMHPEEARRKESMRKAFSGSRDDIEENDLRAYLASEGSDSEPEDDDELAGPSSAAAPAATDEPKLSKKELARRKMREALGLSAEPTSKKSDVGPVGDMQITFTSALSEKEKKKEPGEDETTLEKYMRKERERKEKKRVRNKAKRNGEDGEDAATSDVEMVFGGTGGDGDDGDDMGFDDPFFTAADPSLPTHGDGSAPASKTAKRKEDRLKKRAEREQKEATLAAEKKKLAAVMAENEADRASRAEHLDHFDMADIRKAERAAAKGKKGRKAKRANKAGAGDDDEKALQTDYQVPVDDARFGAVFTQHEFAIDPSDPKFSGTAAMKTILEEGRKKRKNADEADGEARKKTKKKQGADAAGAGDIKDLVAAVKRKTKN